MHASDHGVRQQTLTLLSHHVFSYMQNTPISYVASFQECYMDAASVAKYVIDNALASGPVAFIASGTVSEDQMRSFMQGPITAVLSLDGVCTKVG